MMRSYAATKGPDDTVLPKTPATSPADITHPAVTTPAAASTTTVIPPENIPRAPPSPQQVQTSPGTSIPPPASPPASSSPAPKPRKGRFRRFLVFLITAAGISYAGGVYYALVNDNFHDFFTEYVPYGEEAVLYFEEREFQRRFPQHPQMHKMYPQVSGENKQTFSGRSGMTARIAEDAADTSKDSLGKTDRAVAEKKTDKSTTLEKAKQATASVVSKAEETASAVAGSGPAKKIEPLNLSDVANADDVVVAKMAKVINDVIAVINADGASGTYSSTLESAKESIKGLASEAKKYEEAAAEIAEKKIRENQTQFDEAAKELLRRVSQEQQDRELSWREEYEVERERLANTYQNKLQSELEAAQQVSEQRLRNELLEQSIKLQEDFTKSIKDRVESERSGRLSKLNELNDSLADIEDVTSKWSEVIDLNQRTQHLVVAVEAVRHSLESADRPRPFVHELAALKEVGQHDAVIDAAIASINPSAYQRGLPTSAQLIDRFRRVANEVRKASLLPEDAGAASHAASLVLSKLMFKKQGLAVGDDVESILTRTETYLEEGNLDEATREMNGLKGWAKVLSRDWLNEARSILEVKQAIEVC